MSPAESLISTVTIRALQSLDEYRRCYDLQVETWGDDFMECVPPSLLKVCQKIGGVVAGAFDQTGRMLGFVFGMTGLKGGKLVHWSHMLAVAHDVRGLGIGKRLKLFQREQLLPLGVKEVYWTFDPLVARNANLNINGLGACIEEYVENMYSESTSKLHQGLGMDRFIVVWHLDDPRVRQAAEGNLAAQGNRFTDAPIVNTKLDASGEPVPADLDLPDAPLVRIEVPRDIETIQGRAQGRGMEWRSNTRRAFRRYLDRGYAVSAFSFDASGRAFYGLELRSKGI